MVNHPWLFHAYLNMIMSYSQSTCKNTHMQAWQNTDFAETIILFSSTCWRKIGIVKTSVAKCCLNNADWIKNWMSFCMLLHDPFFLHPVVESKAEFMHFLCSCHVWFFNAKWWWLTNKKLLLICSNCNCFKEKEQQEKAKTQLV